MASFLHICKKIIFSHIGLLFFLFGYCLLGARLFQMLEQDAPLDMAIKGMKRAQEIEYHRAMIIERIRNVSRYYDADVDGITYRKGRRQMALWLDDYHLDVTRAIRQYGYDGTVPTTPKNPWNIYAGYVFTTSIVTLIGYGNLAPKTGIGQAFVIVYALVGVPLMLMVIARFTEAFTHFLRLLFFRAVCCYCQRRRINEHQRLGKSGDEIQPNLVATGDQPFPILFAFVFIVIYCMLGGGIFVLIEEWSFAQAIYFSIISLLTIGFGDYIPQHEHGTLILSLYIIGGLAIMGTLLNIIMMQMLFAGHQAAVELGAREICDLDGDGKDDKLESIKNMI